MKHKKIIISIILCTLCALGCDFFRNRAAAPKVAAELSGSGEKITGPGIFTDCTYGLLDQSISDHAPVIYGKTGTWNIATFADDTILGSDPTFFIHKFRASSDGTLIDLKNNPILLGEKSEGSFKQPNKYYVLRLKALADKINELFKDKSLDSLALQEIPSNILTDSAGTKLLAEFAEKLKPLVLIPPNKYPGEESAPDVALVVRDGSAMKPQLSSKDLRAQSYCDFETKACIVSAHIPGSLVHLDNAEKKGLDTPDKVGAALDKKYIALCEEVEKFAERLKELHFTDIKYLGDFNVSGQKIRKLCTWQQPAPTIRSYEGEGSSCSDNAGKLSGENIDIMIEFNYKN